MKKIFIVLYCAVLSFGLIACANGKANDEDKDSNKNEASAKDSKSQDDALHVYYFHTNIRCVTCVSVEKKTEENLQLLFPEEMKSGKITFKALNMETPGNEDLVEQYEIYGQTLLFVKGDSILDKTNDAFLNAASEPEKWQNMVKETVTGILK